MLIDRLQLRATCNELTRILKGSRVNKIVQTDSDLIFFDIYPSVEKRRLVCSIDRQYGFIGLIQNKQGNCTPMPVFCALLRKHLTHAIIQEFVTSMTDRIINIVFSVKSEEKIFFPYLQLRLTGNKPNLLFFDEHNHPLGKMTDYSKHSGTPSHDRDYGSEHLTIPRTSQPFTIIPSPDEIVQILHDGRSAGNIADTIKGMTPSLSEFALKCISTAQERILFSTWLHRLLLDEIPEHTVVIKNSLTGKSFLFPYGHPPLLPPNTVVIDKGSLIEELNTFYFTEMSKSTFTGKKRSLARALGKMKKKVTRKKCTLEDGLLKSRNGKQLSHEGELLKSVLYKIKRGDSFVPVFDWEAGRERELAIDSKLSPKENLERCFARARKAKRTIPVLKQQIEETVFVLAQIEKLSNLTEKATSLEALSEIEENLRRISSQRKKQKQLKLTTRSGKNLKTSKEKKVKKQILQSIRTYVSSDGLKIFVGRNGLENACLCGKFLQKNDMWFHLSDEPGPHVVVKLGNRDECPSSTKMEAAQLAVYFSSRKYEKRSKVTFCRGRDVRNIPGGKPGEVSLRNYNYITVIPDQGLINGLLSVSID